MDPAGRKPLAFEREEREFVDGIEAPQLARELEAVDDLRLGLEADVLGAQVAVRLDDAAGARALVEELRVALERSLLAIATSHSRPRGRRRDAELAPVLGDLRGEPPRYVSAGIAIGAHAR